MTNGKREINHQHPINRSIHCVRETAGEQNNAAIVDWLMSWKRCQQSFSLVYVVKHGKLSFISETNDISFILFVFFSETGFHTKFTLNLFALNLVVNCIGFLGW